MSWKLLAGLGLASLILTCFLGLHIAITAGSPRYWGYPVKRACGEMVKPGMTKQAALDAILAMGEPRFMIYQEGGLLIGGEDHFSCMIRLDSSGAEVLAVELRNPPVDFK